MVTNQDKSYKRCDKQTPQ